MDVAPGSPLPDPSEGSGEGAVGQYSADVRRERARTRRRRILRGAVIGGVVASVAAYIGLLVMVGEATATPRRSESESPVGVASTTDNTAGMIAVGLAVVIVLTSTLVALRLVFSRHPIPEEAEDTGDRGDVGSSVGGLILTRRVDVPDGLSPPPGTRAADDRDDEPTAHGSDDRDV
ncbi:hypothetical protein [Labedella endophytica]|uniref:Uncharacterized protein n=1 Tax=Labedella endophytica TaxID=1523160 RepID=A0A433JUU0_9MICO|nr:hypothetical protein [Labedella endophytica]RUR01911.1 hypothetical protein ELQ94_10735 [Labedella endophytica]